MARAYQTAVTAAASGMQSRLIRNHKGCSQPFQCSLGLSEEPRVVCLFPGSPGRPRGTAHVHP